MYNRYEMYFGLGYGLWGRVAFVKCTGIASIPLSI